MSTAARLISGSAALWSQIAVNLTAQIVLVPIYLKYWSVETYGVWLAIQGIMSVLSMLDLGHQNFMAFEFLRLGPKNILDLSKSLWSAIVVSTLISLLQIILSLLFIVFGVLPLLVGESSSTENSLMSDAGITLVIQGIVWLVVISVSGLMVRVLAPFGYYPRFVWWGLLYTILAAIAPLLVVIFGGGLLMAGVATAIGAFIYAVVFYVDLFRLLRKVKIRIIKPSFALGYSNFCKSLPLLGKSLFENVRQQGVRLLLAPLAGAAGLAAFSTMRTSANVALQGLNTIVNPIIPDLMRFLHDRDQERSEAAFATIWIVVIAGVAPGIVLLQVIIEPFFVFWTQGKITFDPVLFALLSLSVLVYAVVQPAMAVVIGNNLTKIQLVLTGIAAVSVFLVLAVLVPLIGIVGASIALLAAEIIAAVGYKIYAERWLNENQLAWPNQPFRIAVMSVIIAALTLTLIILFSEYKWVITLASIFLFAWNFWRYWQVLPIVAIHSAKNIVNKIPGVRKLSFLFDS